MKNGEILFMLFIVFSISVYFHFNIFVIILSLFFSILSFLLMKKTINVPYLFYVIIILILCVIPLLRANIFDDDEISLVDYPFHISSFNSFSESGVNHFFNSFRFGVYPFLSGKYVPTYIFFIFLKLFVPNYYLAFRLLIFLSFISVPISIFYFLKETASEGIAVISSIMWILQTHDIFIYGAFYNYFSISLCLLSFLFFSTNFFKSFAKSS